MNLLVIIPTLGYGGAERLLVTLLPKLKSKGYNIKVCVFHSNIDLVGELNKNGIPVKKLNLKHRWSIFEAIYKLTKEIRVFKPNILWAHLYFGILYSRFASIFFKKLKVVSVLHYHVSSDSIKKGLWYSFRNWVFSKSKKSDFATIAVSNCVKEDYEKYYGWQNIEVIYNVIDTTKLNNVFNNTDIINTKRELNIQANSTIITIPGRLHESKGHKYLIAAIKKLKNNYNLTPIVIIAGDGQLKNDLIKLIENLKLQNQFILTGNLKQAKLFDIICASDLIVTPSLFEAFGLVVIEAMFLKKPVIVTKIGGLAEITKDKYDAIQVPVKNSKAIALAISELINDNEKVEYLINNAKNTASNYGVNQISKQWNDLFKRDVN